MNNSVKTDDVIFNFFKQICDEKDELKCVELGNSYLDKSYGDQFIKHGSKPR